MDAQQLLSEFLSTEHGAQAMQALTAQGYSDADAQQLLGHATEAAQAHVEEQHAGLMGSHPGKSFFAAFAAGLVQGDGFFKSLEDGGEGVISARIAEAVANKAGVDSSAASTIAAAATPFLVSFLKSKLG
ncbi:hypothetical protein [Roseateles saccharophilus]|uniref:Uncharacterized protein n=1 Tax=Roseateles saccharophilus TaxID=304 RepID=A0A4V2VSH6_ROSSA|nr:hypothetical protein [Roseateles saccharophilus]MDG0832176.1 hypothetical protein [Roseateles saccharophilus]TCV02450.1 hypothetical protein EV671_1004225 [Roseateles saccharophilus]